MEFGLPPFPILWNQDILPSSALLLAHLQRKYGITSPFITPVFPSSIAFSSFSPMTPLLLPSPSSSTSQPTSSTCSTSSSPSSPVVEEKKKKSSPANCICSICGKVFSRHWLLQGHIRTHTGERPFKCSHCPKAFADKSNLRAHTQTHSGDKPHVCHRCGKRFALRSYLSKHEESACYRFNDSVIPSN